MSANQPGPKELAMRAMREGKAKKVVDDKAVERLRKKVAAEARPARKPKAGK